MATTLTQNGISTCTALGSEKFEKFTAANGKKYIQYDYRDTDGGLFSTVKPTLQQCREERDKWLNTKHVKKK